MLILDEFKIIEDGITEKGLRGKDLVDEWFNSILESTEEIKSNGKSSFASNW